jgi:hypothetical protein
MMEAWLNMNHNNEAETKETFAHTPDDSVPVDI